MLKKKLRIKFSDLIRKYDITNIDLLQIDIEGYDGTLSRIDFDSIKLSLLDADKHIDTALKMDLQISPKYDGHKIKWISVGNRTNGFDRVCRKNINHLL